VTSFALWGAIETGLVFAFVGIGVYLAFRILDFPDLTVDGSFPLGGAVTAVLILGGWNPWAAMAAAAVAGALAGLVTAALNVWFRILHILASILTMTALYSINIRVMDRPNMPIMNAETVLTPFLHGTTPPAYIMRPIVLAVLVAIAVALVVLFLATDTGLAMRATGANKRMARAQGVRTGGMVFLGLALSNALVAVGGSLFTQTSRFADVTAGVGTIVVGLAAVIIGETLLPGRRILVAVIGCVIGSVIYRVAVQFALSADFLGLQASDLRLVIAVLVAVALILPRLRRGGSST